MKGEVAQILSESRRDEMQLATRLEALAAQAGEATYQEVLLQLVGKDFPAAPWEQLMGAALKLFTRRGYSATTVRELVEAAGATKPVLYYYFGSKEGLFLELMRTHFGRLEAIVGRHPSGGARRSMQLLSWTRESTSRTTDDGVTELHWLQHG